MHTLSSHPSHQGVDLLPAEGLFGDDLIWFWCDLTKCENESYYFPGMHLFPTNTSAFKLPNLRPLNILTMQQTNSINADYLPFLFRHACSVVCFQSIYVREIQLAREIQRLIMVVYLLLSWFLINSLSDLVSGKSDKLIFKFKTTLG